MEYLDSNFEDHVKELCEMIIENSYDDTYAIRVKAQEILDTYYQELTELEIN